MPSNYIIDNPNTEEVYYKLLEDIDRLKRNYWNYTITDPILSSLAQELLLI